MTANNQDVEQWSDEDAYYWVFKISISQEHAVAIWNGAIDGKQLMAMKKGQLLEVCKNLDAAETSRFWREIKKLQKQNRKSIFGGKRGKPAPLAADYHGDDSFDDDSEFDSEEDVNDSTEDMNNQSSLQDRLKERLKEFKAQQQEENCEQEMYLDPDNPDDPGNHIEEPQDEYEEFDGPEEEDDQYIAPQSDGDPPPPVPSRVPMSNTDSNQHGAPVLPPRPGHSPSKALPRPNQAAHQPPHQAAHQPPHQAAHQPPHQAAHQAAHQAPPESEEDEEEYIVPDLPDSEALYLPPNEPEDCGETYIEPNEVQSILPKKPHPRHPLPRPPMPGSGFSSGLKVTKSFSKPSDIKKQPPLPGMEKGRPVSQSIASRRKQFDSMPVPQPPKPAAPQGGSLWQIQHNTQPKSASSNLNLPSRKISPGFNPPLSPKRATSPRAAPPLPSPTMPRSVPALPNPARSSPTPQNPTVSRQNHAPPSTRQYPSRTHTPDLPRPPFQNSSRPKDQNNMSDCKWFHISLSREEATSALQRYREEGTFVVRQSTKKPGFPYTLQLFYKGKIRNLQIGVRQDNKYALGALKEGETRFSSVRELIEYHRSHDVVLANNEGRTCLINPLPIS